MINYSVNISEKTVKLQVSPLEARLLSFAIEEYSANGKKPGIAKRIRHLRSELDKLVSELNRLGE